MHIELYTIEIVTMADIPSEGSGLGSSSTLTVGLLNALYTYKGIMISPEELAQKACEIEINILGKPIGKQDQYIAAYGGVTNFIFNKDEEVKTISIDIEQNKLKELSTRLMLFHTGVSRVLNFI